MSSKAEAEGQEAEPRRMVAPSPTRSSLTCPSPSRRIAWCSCALAALACPCTIAQFDLVRERLSGRLSWPGGAGEAGAGGGVQAGLAGKGGRWFYFRLNMHSSRSKNGQQSIILAFSEHRMQQHVNWGNGAGSARGLRVGEGGRGRRLPAAERSPHISRSRSRSQSSVAAVSVRETSTTTHNGLVHRRLCQVAARGVAEAGGQTTGW